MKKYGLVHDLPGFKTHSGEPFTIFISYKNNVTCINFILIRYKYTFATLNTDFFAAHFIILPNIETNNFFYLEDAISWMHKMFKIDFNKKFFDELNSLKLLQEMSE